MPSTLEIMQGSTGIVMGHQSINERRTSNNQLASSYTAQRPLPSIHPVARGATPSLVALPPSFCLVADLHKTCELTLLKASNITLPLEWTSMSATFVLSGRACGCWFDILQLKGFIWNLSHLEVSLVALMAIACCFEVRSKEV
jgi:hypothetical protein